MVPILVLVVSFSVLVVLGRLGVTALRDWLTCLRWALALMFVVTASAHWGSRRADLVQMVPASFSDPELWVTLTGIAELAGAVGLVVPRLAPLAATG
ncbi:MAG: DoxX family protein, partial [Kofleriaceae bacterium]